VPGHALRTNQRQHCSRQPSAQPRSVPSPPGPAPSRHRRPPHPVPPPPTAAGARVVPGVLEPPPLAGWQGSDCRIADGVRRSCPLSLIRTRAIAGPPVLGTITRRRRAAAAFSRALPGVRGARGWGTVDRGRARRSVVPWASEQNRGNQRQPVCFAGETRGGLFLLLLGAPSPAVSFVVRQDFAREEGVSCLIRGVEDWFAQRRPTSTRRAARARVPVDLPSNGARVRSPSSALRSHGHGPRAASDGGGSGRAPSRFCQTLDT